MDGNNETSTDSKTSNIVSLLKQFSEEGLSFEQANEKLLSRGYSAAEIRLATDQYSYGEKQTTDIPTKVTEYFQSHTDEALTDGTNLLKAQRKEDLADERNQAILDIAASEAASRLGVGNIDAKVEYESKFAFDVGISFWLLVGMGVAVNVAAFLIVNHFHIPRWYYAANGLLTILIVILLIKRMK